MLTFIRWSALVSAIVAVAVISNASSVQAATVNVNLGNFWFNDSANCNNVANPSPGGPCTATITEGDSITWTNTSISIHTATECGASFETIDCPLSGGFDTGFITGTTTSAPITFNTPGTFRYRCEVHPFSMRAWVIVQSTGATIEAEKSQTDLNGGTLAPGDTIEYSVTLTNSGGTQLDNPGNEYEDEIPASAAYVAASASATSGTVAFEPGPPARITWNGSIPGGGNVTITFRVQVDGGAATGTLIRNQGTANYDSDGDGTNDAQEPTDNPDTTTVDDDPTVMTVDSPADDLDGDGYTDPEEERLGTNPSDRCGAANPTSLPSPDYPSDTFGSGTSFNNVNIQDVTAFVTPPQNYQLVPTWPIPGVPNTEPSYEERFNLFNGTGSTDEIDFQDITALVTGSRDTPPMFNGAKAFGNPGPTCTES